MHGDRSRTHGNDRARHLLIAALLLSLAADELFPHDSAAAAVISASFWLYGLVIVAFTVGQLVLRGRYGSSVPVLKWVLLAMTVVSLYVYGCYVEKGTQASHLVALLYTGALLTLVILAIRDTVRRYRTSD
jgi:hypothetical protein